MASRKSFRNTKNIKKEKILDYSSLKLGDVLCPICRSILIEPVTLPCNHGFCLSCFNDTMENTNLVCPLCRIRIGSWIRKTKKEGKLVNEEFWKALKEKFSQHVKNKLSGVDENLEEEPQIRVSAAGEIRKEYEIQKRKEEEEFQRKQAADLMANEELIRKIKEEDEYHQVVMKEKLKLDQAIAKKLAEQLSQTSPSTSKAKSIKKCGPMDKFVTHDNETDPNLNNNFTTKEYTCRVLCLDGQIKNVDEARKKISSPIKKKIQQIQKLVDAEMASDGSDCIESELRYFKPIDHKVGPSTEGKPAIKIPSKKANKNKQPNILSPSGIINFHSSILESAFARISFSMSSPNFIKNHGKLKRTCSTADQISTSTPKRRKSTKKSTEKYDDKESPTLLDVTKQSNTKRQLFGKITINNLSSRSPSSSPPFYGFDNTSTKVDSSFKKTNTSPVIYNNEKSRKTLQEMEDLEFAKNLQDEFNKNLHFTRSSRKVSAGRQTTLDEIMVKNRYRIK